MTWSYPVRVFSNTWENRQENEGESTSERRQEHEERVHGEWNAPRLEDANLQSLFPYYPVPFFNKYDQRREAILTRAIHVYLLDSPQFFDYSKEHCTHAINVAVSNNRLFAAKAAFESPEDFMEFLRRRRFLFYRRPEDSHYRNTGFGHRIIVGEIVRYVQMISSTTRYTLQNLIYDFDDKIRNGRIMVSDGAERDGKWPQPWMEYSQITNVPVKDTIKAIVEGYPEIFRLEIEHSEVFVGLQQLAFTVPSLWSEKVLPVRPTEPYFDKSRTEVFLAKVISFRYGYMGRFMEAQIDNCHYGNRVVCIFEGYPTDLSKIRKIQVGCDVIISAHVVLCCCCEFFGISIVPVPREHLGRIASAGLSMPSLPAGNYASYVPLTELSAAERSLILFVDGIFENQRLTEEEFVKKLRDLWPLRSYALVFLHIGAAWTFVCERPHLYYFNGEQAGVLCKVARRAYNAIFECLDENANKTAEDISAVVKKVGYQRPVGDLIDRLLLCSVLSFTMNTRRKTSKALRICRFSLKVNFDKAQHILIPGYPRVPPHFPGRRLF